MDCRTSIAVRDPDRSLRFYTQVFGVKEYYRDTESIQIQDNLCATSVFSVSLW